MKLTRILVGYDGSAYAKASILDLGRAGLPAATDVVVLAATDPWAEVPYLGFVPPEPGAVALVTPATRGQATTMVRVALRQARRLAAEGAAVARIALSDANVRPEAAEGPAADALVLRARGWRPDLVVVGTHGRSALARVLLGSVSQAILERSPCSVRIGRRHPPRPAGRTSGPPRLLIGIDGSAAATSAAAAVAARHWPRGADVRAVTVVDALLSAVHVGRCSAPAEPAWMVEACARRALEAAVGCLRAAGLTAAALVLEGEPALALVREAERWAADCIFLGAKGHGRLERMLLGSVSSSVAARAPCTVEVFRRAPCHRPG